MSEYWALNDEGRLYIPNLTPESIAYDLDDRNYGSFYLNSERRIDADAMPNSIQSVSPFPMGVWIMQSDGKLHAGGMPNKIYGQSPYPYGVWYLKSIGIMHAGGMPETLGWEEPYLPTTYRLTETTDKPILETYPNIDLIGAFANATDLVLIKSNDKLRKIGTYSFRNTSLTEVEIPDDCVYEETSFPDGCVVNPDE